MPRLLTMLAAMALAGAALALNEMTPSVPEVTAQPAATGTAVVVAERRPAECVAPVIDTSTGETRTARALTAALRRRDLDGRVWLGKLGSVGGGRRDTLVYVPRALDPARTIELVVYLEGHGSFADDAMDHRHARAIAHLEASGGNVVYVAPDAPSSAHGEPRARTPYWQRGRAARRCAGGHAAPGDFVAFLEDARARVASLACARPADLDVRLSLIGFSNGGKGVWNAMAQLAAEDFVVAGRPVRLGDVVFADGNYGAAWLRDTWAWLAARPEAPRLTILVGDGAFDGADRAAGNRQRAAAFWREAAPDVPMPRRGHAVETPRLRLVPLRGGHHAIGDVAVEYLRIDGRPGS